MEVVRFSRKEADPGGGARGSQGALIVLQSFQARALQAHSRGATEPFYEAFVAARPTARAWAMSAAEASQELSALAFPTVTHQVSAQDKPDISIRKNGSGIVPVAPGSPVDEAAKVALENSVGRVERRDGELCGRGYPEGGPRASGSMDRPKTPREPKGEVEELQRGKQPRIRDSLTEDTAPSSSCSSVEGPGEVDALCYYLQTLNAWGRTRTSPRPSVARDDPGVRLRQLLTERESIRGALGRLGGMLEALRSIESRARAAKWAASVGAQSLSSAPSPRRGALATACLGKI